MRALLAAAVGLWLALPLAVAVAQQATPAPGPTADATLSALERAKLEEEVEQLRWDNDRDLWHWLWDNSVVLGAALAGVFGVYRWSVDRRDARMRQAEARFQALAADLDSDRAPARTNAAVTLRTFLRPGYEDYYAQVFNLAVAHIRIQPLPQPLSAGPGVFMQALTAAFLESFPLARDWVKYGLPHPAGPRWRRWLGRLRNRPRAGQLSSQYAVLDGSRVGFVYGNFVGADLREAWLPFAEFIRSSLTGADLSGANLQNATIGNTSAGGARFVGADLRAAVLGSVGGDDFAGADFTDADLSWATASRANFYKARFVGADLTGIDLTGAMLKGADFTDADPAAARSLAGARITGANGLPDWKRAECAAKGAIVDDDNGAAVGKPAVEDADGAPSAEHPDAPE